MFYVRLLGTLAAGAFLAASVTGCATAPKSQAERQSLQSEAEAAYQGMTAKDSSLADFIDRAAGYAIFPSVGKAGFIAGGGYGRGILYENGRPTGYVEINQGSVGAQIGAETYNELVVFENEAALDKLKKGKFEFGASASAVALKAGVGGAGRFVNGVAVFVQPKGGLMAEASITGQKLNYEPMDSSEAESALTRSNRMRQ
jgi:lipid-binding SYLF domain-containing protein